MSKFRVLSIISGLIFSLAIMSCDSGNEDCAGEDGDCPECQCGDCDDSRSYVPDFEVGDLSFTNVWVPDVAEAGYPMNIWFDIDSEAAKYNVYVKLSFAKLETGDIQDLDMSDPNWVPDYDIGAIVIEKMEAGESRHVTATLDVSPAIADGTYAAIFTINSIDFFPEDDELQGEDEADSDNNYLVAPASIIVGVPDLPNIRVLYSELAQNSFELPVKDPENIEEFDESSIPDDVDVGDGEGVEAPKGDISLSVEVEAMALHVTDPVKAVFKLGIPGETGTVWHVLDISDIDDDDVDSPEFTYLQQWEYPVAEHDVPILQETVSESGTNEPPEEFPEDSDAHTEKISASLVRQEAVGNTFELFLPEEAWDELRVKTSDTPCVLKIIVDPDYEIEEWENNKADNVSELSLMYLVQDSSAQPQADGDEDENETDGDSDIESDEADINKATPIVGEADLTKSYTTGNVCWARDGRPISNSYSNYPFVQFSGARSEFFGNGNFGAGYYVSGVFSHSRGHRENINNGDWVFLRSWNGYYLMAHGGGGGAITATSQGGYGWESFQIMQNEQGETAIKTYNGHYLCSENGGGSELVANRTGWGPWETFVLEDINGGTLENGDEVRLRGYNAQYVMAHGGGGGGLCVCSNNQREWETFIVYKKDPMKLPGVDQSLVLQGKIGTYNSSWFTILGNNLSVLEVIAEVDISWLEMTTGKSVTKPPDCGHRYMKTRIMGIDVFTEGLQTFETKDEEISDLYGGGLRSVSREWAVGATWWIGPVPLGFRAGFRATLGLNIWAQKGPYNRVHQIAGPYVSTSAFADGGLSWPGGGAGLGVDLYLLYLAQDFHMEFNPPENRLGFWPPLSYSTLNGYVYLYAFQWYWWWGWQRAWWQTNIISWGGWGANNWSWATPWSITVPFTTEEPN